MREAHQALRCQHIKLNGKRCAAPALRGRRLCHFHSRALRPKKLDYSLPLIEDATSLQFALMQVIRALQDKAMDPRCCGLMLYSLQIACSNLKRFAEEQPEPRRVVSAGPSLPHVEVPEKQPESLAELLLNHLRRGENADSDEYPDPPRYAPLPTPLSPVK